MSDTDPYAAPSAATKVEKKAAPTPVEKVVEVEKKEPLVVPEGPAKDILAWVGDDKERASLALDAENVGQKRTTLITKLTAIVEE